MRFAAAVAGVALAFGSGLFAQEKPAETPEATRARMEKLTAKLAAQFKEVTCYTCHGGHEK